MLVLTRRVGEAIKIDVDVTVKVLSVSGNRVRLGIEAPLDVPIAREEVRQAPLREALHRAMREPCMTG